MRHPIHHLSSLCYDRSAFRTLTYTPVHCPRLINVGISDLVFSMYNIKGPVEYCEKSHPNEPWPGASLINSSRTTHSHLRIAHTGAHKHPPGPPDRSWLPGQGPLVSGQGPTGQGAAGVVCPGAPLMLSPPS